MVYYNGLLSLCFSFTVIFNKHFTLIFAAEGGVLIVLR
jgi:hypothetical protein